MPCRSGSLSLTKTVLWCGVCLLVLSVSLVAAVHSNGFGVNDDAYISFRYAKNLAAGHGLRFNLDGPPTEGFSNFLLVLILACAYKLGLNIIQSSVAIGGRLGYTQSYFSVAGSPHETSNQTTIRSGMGRQLLRPVHSIFYLEDPLFRLPVPKHILCQRATIHRRNRPTAVWCQVSGAQLHVRTCLPHRIDSGRCRSYAISIHTTQTTAVDPLCPGHFHGSCGGRLAAHVRPGPSPFSDLFHLPVVAGRDPRSAVAVQFSCCRWNYRRPATCSLLHRFDSTVMVEPP